MKLLNIDFIGADLLKCAYRVRFSFTSKVRRTTTGHWNGIIGKNAVSTKAQETVQPDILLGRINRLRWDFKMQGSKRHNRLISNYYDLNLTCQWKLLKWESLVLSDVLTAKVAKVRSLQSVVLAASINVQNATRMPTDQIYGPIMTFYFVYNDYCDT
jgi:hypothetical protein